MSSDITLSQQFLLGRANDIILHFNEYRKYFPSWLICCNVNMLEYALILLSNIVLNMFLIYFYNERPIFFHCLTLNGIHSKLVYRIKVFLVHKMSEETQILYTLVVRKDVYPEPTMTRRVKWTLSRFSSVWTEPWCYLGFGALVNSRSNTSCMELNWGCLSLSRGWLSSMCATVKKRSELRDL